MYPNTEEIIALHHKYAPIEKVFNIVFTHCVIVEEIALQLNETKQLDVNVDLVKSGALLHDIGAYQFINADGIFDRENYIFHGIAGYKILQQEGLPEELCRIAERHTSVGITQQDIIKQKLSLPLKDYIAETLEEKLIMYADKFHSKNPQFNTYATYQKFVRGWGEDKVEKFEKLATIFGKPELTELAKKYKHSIK